MREKKKLGDFFGEDVEFQISLKRKERVSKVDGGEGRRVLRERWKRGVPQTNCDAYSCENGWRRETPRVV